MKRINIFVFLALSGGLFWALMIMLEWRFPEPDISGCYYFSTKQYSDKICLYKDGRYQQFYRPSGGVYKNYNSGMWRDFSYEDEYGVFVAGSVDSFVAMRADGSVDAISDIDIRPYKNIFCEVYFYSSAGSADSFMRYRRED